MPSDHTNLAPPVDGRRARRERSRATVIDAVFALVDDGKVPPSAEQVAERSGVSVSSIFRMFDGLDDMRNQAFEQFEHRYSHLIDADVDQSTQRTARVRQFVHARVELSSAAGPLMRMARQRALDHERVADRVGTQRMLLAEQTQRFFRAETADLTPADAANLCALIDATTSPEAFEVLSAAHSRTRRQIERTWQRALTALVADWCDQPNVTTTPAQGEPT